jgi:hypothetical protein
MAVSVDIDLGYEFVVKAAFKDVFAVVSDVPTSVSYFPKVDQLVDLGGGVYRWEMAKVGAGQASLQTVYASKYVVNKAKGTVVWTPVKGEGNALVGGSWKASEAPNGKEPKGTALELKIKGTVEVPVPGLMKMVVAPVVKAEFEKLVEKYIDNLIKKFGGEV